MVHYNKFIVGVLVVLRHFCNVYLRNIFFRPGMLEVCQEISLPHIVVSDNPNSSTASDRHNVGSDGRRVKFRLEAVEVIPDREADDQQTRKLSM